MNPHDQVKPAPQAPSPSGTYVRRLLVAAVIGVFLFGMLWYAVFSAVTAALIAAGGTGMIVVGSSISDAVEAFLEMLANALAAVLAAIAAVFAAIFSIFS